MSGFIPLSLMRRTQEWIMPSIVSIQRPTRVSDGMGGFNETWVVINPNCKARISAPDLGRFAYRPQETVIGEAELEIVPLSIILPYGTDILNSDRIIFGSDTYEVVKVLSGGSYASAVRVAVKEIV